jgi:hypothetical protein
MIAVAVAVIIGVVAVTCGIVAGSNHADTLTFLGLMVKTTAAQIFLAGAICTWALFAALWLLSAGIRRSKERGLELRLLKALRRPALFGAAAATAPTMSPDRPNLAGLAPTARTATGLDDQAMSAPAPAPTHAAHMAAPADPTDSTDDPADSEPTIDFDDLDSPKAFGSPHDLNGSSDRGHPDNFNDPSALDHARPIAEPSLRRHIESGRFYRANPQPNSAD